VSEKENRRGIEMAVDGGDGGGDGGDGMGGDEDQPA
jgi:hypothetical protein